MPKSTDTNALIGAAQTAKRAGFAASAPPAETDQLLARLAAHA